MITTEALPVAALKEHLRLGTGFSEENLQDGLLEAYLRSALATIEGKIGLVLVPRAFAWQLTGWRDAKRQVLPVRPITAINAVKIYDRAGGVNELPIENFDFVPDVMAPALTAKGTSLPTVPSGGTAEIIFEAGYGPEWEDIPSDLSQSVVLLAAHFYENRTGAVEGSGCLPMAVSALLERHRPLRVFKGV